jgi:Ca2+-binding RTX toxin-like protein
MAVFNLTNGADTWPPSGVSNKGNDEVRGKGGSDTIKGGNWKDKLFGDSADDKLWGDGGNDNLYGGTGKDTIRGGTGDDKIFGDAGNDKLWGDAGNDSLTGGADKDTFNYSFIGNTIPTDSPDGDDTITDLSFEDGDVLVLDDVDNFFFGSNQQLVDDWDATGEITVNTEGDDTIINFTGTSGGSIELKGLGSFDFNSLTDINNASQSQFGYDAMIIV